MYYERFIERLEQRLGRVRELYQEAKARGEDGNWECGRLLGLKEALELAQDIMGKGN